MLQRCVALKIVVASKGDVTMLHGTIRNDDF